MNGTHEESTTIAAGGPASATTLQLAEDALVAAAQVVPTGSPVVMVNLLRFREVADYGEDVERGAVAAGATGRAAYSDGYVPAFAEVAARQGIETELLYHGQAHTALVAPATERWDDVVLVRYPSFADFQRIVSSAAYAQQADHHRLAALADWRLIATSPLDPPS